MTVQISRDQLNDPDDRGNPVSVGEAMLCFMVPVKYYDKQGKPHQEFVFVVGDTVYKDPSGEAWASRLKVMSDTLATDVVARTNQQLEGIIRKVVRNMGVAGTGAQDSVDILADETDKDVTPTAK